MRGCQLIDLALGFARDQEDLEAVVIGVCSCHELAELSAAWSSASLWQEGESKNWSLQNADILDPRLWASAATVRKDDVSAAN